MFDWACSWVNWLVVLGVAAAACSKGQLDSGREPGSELCVSNNDSVDGAVVDTAGADGSIVSAGVSTLAGGAQPGFVDGAGTTARFDNPVNVAVGPDGLLYVADRKNGAVRRVTAEGIVSTFVQCLSEPFGLAFSNDGTLFVTGDDGVLRRIERNTGIQTVVATGLGLVRGIVANADGTIVTSALLTHVIWLVEPDGATSILAGAFGQSGLVDATGSAARFDQPVDIVALADGSFAVADLGNDRIRRLTLTGTVTTLAGTGRGFRDGPIAVAEFDGPSGLALDGGGNLYVSDRFTYRIRKITPGGIVTTIAGDGSDGFRDAQDPLQAELSAIEGIDLAPDGQLLYLADGNAGGSGAFHRIRQLNLSTQ